MAEGVAQYPAVPAGVNFVLIAVSGGQIRHEKAGAQEPEPHRLPGDIVCLCGVDANEPLKEARLRFDGI